eukprot:5692243-Amphidinium_carterae.2
MWMISTHHVHGVHSPTLILAWSFRRKLSVDANVSFLSSTSSCAETAQPGVSWCSTRSFACERLVLHSGFRLQVYAALSLTLLVWRLLPHCLVMTHVASHCTCSNTRIVREPYGTAASGI